jgi:hypothetical protein
MRTVTERQRGNLGSVDTESIRLVEHGRVTIGSGDDDESGLADGDFDAADVLALGGRARGRLNGAVESEEFR